MPASKTRTRKAAPKKAASANPFSGAALLEQLAATPAPAVVEVPAQATATSWAKIAGTDADFRIVAVREHAAANYNEGGWDIVVEAYDTAAIYAVVRTARTAGGAVKRMAEHIGVVADHRAEIVNA